MATIILDIDTEIKPYLDAIDDVTAADVTFIEKCESRLIGLMEKDTQKRFTAGASGEALTLDGIGSIRLWLPYRASAITAIETRVAVYGSWETLSASYYSLSPSGYYLLRSDGLEWPCGMALVRVTGTFGYAANEVPGNVRQLLLEALNWLYRRGRKTFIAGDQEVMAQLRKETNWDYILKPYRGPSYG